MRRSFSLLSLCVNRLCIFSLSTLSMQRQSLGSPGSKLDIHGVLGASEENLTGEAQKWKDQASSLADDDAEDNDKSQKPHKSPPKSEKLIHLIPILTVLCLLVLYLSSHDPSQTGKPKINKCNLVSVVSFYKILITICSFISDLAQFGGFHRLSKPIGINIMQMVLKNLCVVRVSFVNYLCFL